MNSKEDDDMEMRKSSTMNSMYIGSTISKPNVESIINAVATILHSQMLEVSYKRNLKTIFRIKIKEKRSSKTVNCSFSQRKSTSWKNQTHSTVKESLCWEKLQQLRTSLSSLRRFMTALNSLQNVALFALCTLIDWLHSQRCHCSQPTGGHCFYALYLSLKRSGMIDIWPTQILLLSTHSSWLRRSTSLSRNSWSWFNTTWQ